MAEGRNLTVRIVVDKRSAKEAGDEAAKQFQGGLNQIQANAKETGRKAGDALGLGIEQGAKRATSAISGLTAAFAALGGLRVFQQIGEQAIQAAISIDKQVSSLKALTGSAEAATKRFRELVTIARQTPGLTTSLATTLDAQLRIFNVAQQTIDRLLPTIGKLNAISPLGDPRQFVNNLTQLVTQNFERQDLKELVGQSPIAGRLIQEIFNVDNPTNAEAIRKSAKKLGVTTVERLAEEFVNAGQNNSALRNATETIAGQFEKMQDRITLALAPIGDELIKTILPTTEKLVGLVEQNGPKIAEILRNQGDEITRSANAMLLLLDGVFRLVGALDALDQKTSVFSTLNTILNPIALALDALERFQNNLNKPDPNNPLFAGGGRGSAVIVGNRAGLPSNAADTLFAGGGGGSPTIVNNRGQILDSRGKVIGSIPRGGARGGGGSGGGTSTARRRGITTLPLTADELVSSELEGVDDFRTIEAARARGRETRSRLTRESEQFRQDLINEGRDTRRKLTAQADAQAISELQRTGRRDLNRSGQFIGDAVNRGALTSGQADAASQAANRDYAQRLREVLALEQQRGDISAARQDDLTDEINLYDRLGTAISNSERFMRGFNSATISVGDAFDRFGQNVSQALTNTKDLLNGLKQALLGFFNDLLGRSIQSVVGQALAPLAQIFGGGVFGGGAGGAGGGGAGGGGVLGNIFRTPSTVPQSISSSTLQNLVAATGGGIGVPASVSQSVGGLPVFRGNLVQPNAIASSTGGVISAASQPSFLSGIGNSLAGAAPFIGAGIGSSLGGQSITGQIAGAAGGLLAGGAIGAALTTNVFSATATAFLTNPFTIAAGAGLLVGAYFLGKASQRKKDEEASGQYLTQALQSIDQLALGVQSGQIDGGQARQIFESQILGTFKQQISGLKTKSVVESRLTNQVRDLRKVFEDRIPPIIAEQQRKAADSARFSAIDSRLVPQFASGGIVPGINRGFDSVIGRLTPGELILNQTQQGRVRAIAGPDVFSRVGVPAINTTGRYADGGYAMPASGGRSSGGTIVIDRMVVAIDGESIVVETMASRTGEQIVINHIENVNLRKKR